MTFRLYGAFFENSLSKQNFPSPHMLAVCMQGEGESLSFFSKASCTVHGLLRRFKILLGRWIRGILKYLSSEFPPPGALTSGAVVVALHDRLMRPLLRDRDLYLSLSSNAEVVLICGLSVAMALVNPSFPLLPRFCKIINMGIDFHQQIQVT